MKYNTLKFALAAIACLSVMSFAAIPEIRITTQNNQEPTVSGGGMWGGAQTMNYVKITRFELTGAGEYNLTLTPEPQGESDSIRVRGNSTAGADKKPYRIKFDKKQKLFGAKDGAKSWVLLANYYDHTFALNAIAFRLGQKLGLEFTNKTSRHVSLYINNNYKGVYQLTEQIQVNPGRVDIDTTRGYLVEFDYHDAASDEIKFTAAQYSLGTFIKSPELPGCDRNPPQNCNINQTAVKWVQDSVNAVMNKMAASGFPTNGYRDAVDLESYAKYVLIEQLMDNFDFNSKTQSGALPGSNYAYKKNDRSPLYAGPLWDFDLSAVGCTSGGFGGCSFTPHYNSYNEPIKPKHTFYQRLWADPAFMAKLKKTWDKHKSDIDAIPAFVDSIANALNGSVANNVAANPSDLLMGKTTLTQQIYTQEVNKLKSWWPNRVKFFNDELNKLNIDTNADIEGGNPPQPPATNYTLQVARNPSAGGSVSVKVGSGSAQNNPSGQLTANANTSITITATANSGYTFTNWTAVSGSLPSGINANNASITFSINSNVNIRANFTQGNDPNPPTTNYTLQITRNPQDRGNVSVKVGNGSPQANPTNSLSIPSGTSVTITATSAVSPNGNNYDFQNWTAVSGSLPSGVSANSATNTFNITGNVNLRANFQRGGTVTTTYTLTVGSTPSGSGSVSVNGTTSTGQPTTHAAGETVTVTATANNGYAFREWTASGSLPSGVDKNSATVNFAINSTVSMVANFRENNGGVIGTDTLIVEAEDLVPTLGTCNSNNNNNPMCIGTNSSTGVTNIGWINSGDNATYKVNIARDGVYTLVFRIASNGNSTFGVTVNNVSYGTVSGNTGDWDGYTDVTLGYPDIPLSAGENTIRLDFRSAVNVDYFMIIGETQQPPTAVRHNVPKAAVPAVTLRSGQKGFTAMLPATHGYTSYRLMDIRGREVRSGKISQGTTELRFDGLNRSVLFLKLEGKGSPLVLKAVAY